ncbi:MAG: nicotinamide-nucleotide amidohydrolase family protein [Sphaerochaetaceae bacterium]|nr:nicotinamide-nucleotide amidohydrolase family protein [Sphaerochaetaceae bacterium]
MKASVFVIGTELTRGIICDKHVPYLCSSLSRMGYSVIRAVLVPDDGSIEAALKEAVSDSSVLLVTGGLGPTSDDMTRQFISDICSVPLVKDSQAREALSKRLGNRLNGSNEQQAYIPKGFKVLPNPNGTAAGFEGFAKTENGKVYIAAMPGPPKEMHPMYENYVEKSLSSLIGYEGQWRDEYSVFLIPEARLEEMCQKCAREGVKWGTRFQDYRISLYIEGGSASDRKAFISDLKALAGPYLIADGDIQALDLFVEAVKRDGLTVTCAESATGGLCAKLLTDINGASQWFWGSEVTYTDSAKTSLLGVSSDTLAVHNAVSAETALEMAEGSLSRSSGSFAFSVTGLAGPTGELEGKPLGTVYFGFAAKGRESQSVRLNLYSNGRDGSRRRFAAAAFLLSRMYLDGVCLVDKAKQWLYI